MNSRQEEIVSQLSNYSLGAPFIFEPDDYSKGDSRREPADLVWACNDVCILLYMKSKSLDSKSEETVIKKRQSKLIDTNLKQAKGWLTEWKTTRNLVGKNKFQDFDIKYGDFKYCIILGIVDYGPEMWKSHEIFQRENNIEVCATLTQNSFELMFKLEFTFIDIVKVLLLLRKSVNVGLKLSANQIIKDYASNALEKNGIPKDIDITEAMRKFIAADRYLKDMRSLYNLNTNNKKDNDIFALASMFNDIDLDDFLFLRKCLTDILVETKDYRYYKVARLNLKKYTIIISVYGLGNWKLATEPAMKLMKELSNDSGIILLNCEIQYGMGMTVFEPRINMSDTLRLLNINSERNCNDGFFDLPNI